MMFLSEIQLNLSDMRRERISDDYSVHRFVYSLFPVRNTCGGVSFILFSVIFSD